MLERVEGEVDIMHVVAYDGGHRAVLLAHQSPRVLANIGDALPAVVLPDGCEVLVLQIELLEIGQVGDAGRHVAHHTIVVQVEVTQAHEVADGLRDGAGDQIVLQPQVLKEDRVAKLGGQLLAQLRKAREARKA